MDNIIQSLKEFIWDIIGYLIPGLFLLILLNFLVSSNNLVENSFLFNWNIFQNSLIIILGYIFGYIIYSLTRYKIFIQDKLIELLIKLFMVKSTSRKFVVFCNEFLQKRHSSLWLIDFKNSQTYKAVMDKYRNEIPNIDLMNVNEVRNILMSKNDKQAQLIYTFMFRSSMFDHISTIFAIIIFIYSIQLSFNLTILKTGYPFYYLYSSMILLIPLLGNSKRYFFPKAVRIPFSNL